MNFSTSPLRFPFLRLFLRTHLPLSLELFSCVWRFCPRCYGYVIQRLSRDTVFIFWQSRGKVAKMEQAQKDVEKMLPVVQRREFQAMQTEGIRGQKQFLVDTHRERVNAVVCL